MLKRYGMWITHNIIDSMGGGGNWEENPRYVRRISDFFD
jgi:hypothetical protein